MRLHFQGSETMIIQVQALTEEERKTLEVKQHLKMKLILFYFMLTVFAAAFVLLIISVFFTEAATWVKLAFFLFNGILGWSIRALHLHLFPRAKEF
jgi:hypothetical protein